MRENFYKTLFFPIAQEFGKMNIIFLSNWYINVLNTSTIFHRIVPIVRLYAPQFSWIHRLCNHRTYRLPEKFHFCAINHLIFSSGWSGKNKTFLNRVWKLFIFENWKTFIFKINKELREIKSFYTFNSNLFYTNSIDFNRIVKIDNKKAYRKVH